MDFQASIEIRVLTMHKSCAVVASNNPQAPVNNHQENQWVKAFSFFGYASDELEQ